jgi:hypothetical protein
MFMTCSTSYFLVTLKGLWNVCMKKGPCTFTELTAQKKCFVLVSPAHVLRTHVNSLYPIFLQNRECLLLFGAESFVFQFAIQKFKGQDI